MIKYVSLFNSNLNYMQMKIRSKRVMYEPIKWQDVRKRV